MANQKKKKLSNTPILDMVGKDKLNEFYLHCHQNIYKGADIYYKATTKPKQK